MFVGRVVKDGAGHTSDPVCKEDPKTNRHSHHHEKEEGIDQVVNDKATQGREGKLEHVLVDHEAISNRSEMGAFVVIEAEHMCMSMRGVRKPGTATLTTVARGLFETDKDLRDQAYRLMGL